MRFLFNVLLFIAVVAAFAWWFRAYWQRWGRMIRGAQNAFKFVKQVRDANKNGGFSVSGRRPDTQTQDAKTVNVTAKMSVKVGCPICKEMLSEAQVTALRSGSVRCEASRQHNLECPYFGRSLN